MCGSGVCCETSFLYNFWLKENNNFWLSWTKKKHMTGLIGMSYDCMREMADC